MDCSYFRFNNWISEKSVNLLNTVSFNLCRVYLNLLLWKKSYWNFEVVSQMIDFYIIKQFNNAQREFLTYVLPAASCQLV